MPDRDIPPDVLTLIHERLAGLDELEVLLFVRDAPQGASATEVADRLKHPVSSTEAALASLCSASLLVCEGGGGGAERRYAYRPATPELDRAVSSLVAVYGERRLEVMTILTNNAFDRIRSAAARTFADAFVIRRNGRQGGNQGGNQGGGQNGGK